MMENKMTQKQMESWYHSKILRIPHGKQNPTKKYLTEKQVLELFTGKVRLFEKVDGKLDSIDETQSLFPRYLIMEDMTGKYTVHNHVIKYKSLPSTKKIFLDYVFFKSDGTPQVRPYKRKEKEDDDLFIVELDINQYREDWNIPLIDIIYKILELFANRQSEFGSKKMEGIVIKNYDKQKFGKWINDEFEDKIKNSKR